MTQLAICAVWDSAVQAYMKPLFVSHTGGAVRAFVDEVNRVAEGNSLGAHSEDYELHQLATWDDESGVFENVPGETDVILIRGKDAKKA